MKVFLSSTYFDLSEYREAIVRAIDTLGHDLITWEKRIEYGDIITKSIENSIESADVIVLIVGNNYGSTQGEAGKSWVEHEYDLAASKGKPILSFILNGKQKDTSCNESLDSFLKKIMENNLVKFFSDPDELETFVVQGLSRYVSIIKSLQNTKYKWRTIEGLSKDLNLGEKEVSSIVEKLPKILIKSQVNDKNGKVLYTTRWHYRESNSGFKRLIDWFSI